MPRHQFEKGNTYGHLRKGKKNKLTLLKQERRAIFDERVSQIWEKTIDKLKPEYVADQFLGKAPDELKVDIVVSIDQDIAEKNEITPKSADNSERPPSLSSIKVRKKVRKDEPLGGGDKGQSGSASV